MFLIPNPHRSSTSRPIRKHMIRRQSCTEKLFGICVFLLLTLVVHPLRDLGAQNTTPVARIAITLTDSSRQFHSLFAGEIRRLGDIAIVSVEDEPWVVLSGVVICSPDCRRANSYSVALRLSSPFNNRSVNALARATQELFVSSKVASLDSLSTFFSAHLSHYEMNHKLWVANWGSEVYERAARELVRTLDTECFEQYRLLARMNNAMDSDTTRARTLFQEWMNRSWIC